MSKPKRTLLSPSFESFPVTVNRRGRRGDYGTRVLVRIREVNQWEEWEPHEPLFSLVFMDSAEPLHERWRAHFDRQPARQGLDVDSMMAMYEYVWRRATQCQ